MGNKEILEILRAKERLTKISLDDCLKIKDSDRNRISPYMLFCHIFGEIPEVDYVSNLDCANILPKIRERYREQIVHQFFRREAYRREHNFANVYFCIVLAGGVIIHIDFVRKEVYVYFRIEQLVHVNQLWKDIRMLHLEDNEPMVSYMISDGGSHYTKEITVKPSNVDIDLHYNDDFFPVNQVILERLNKKDDSGLVLLHGIPGAGKTNYIRYLIENVRKKVIFLPVHLGGALSSPDMLSFFLDNPQAIFVIEDAEKLVIDRNISNGSAVSAILNMTDGLLSDGLGIQFICTFNTELSRVDKALLRTGRLIANYYFGPLQRDKAQRLSDHLGYQTNILQDMPLASVFHRQESSGSKQSGKPKSSIGFKIDAITTVS